MTDRFNDINAVGNLGRNPNTPAGRVAINGHIDQVEFENRKAKVKKGKTFYRGPTDDQSFAIFARDLCVSRKMYASKKNIHKAHAAFVFATVNGFGEDTDKIYQLIEELEFAGLAGGQGAKYDSTGESPEVDLALVLGGINTITNTGPDRISNGDWVFWTLPDTKDPYEKGRRGSERMVLHTVPYDHKLDKLSEHTLHKLLVGDRTLQYPNKNIDSRWPIMEGAKNLQQAIMQITLDALHTFLVSGLVKLDVEAIGDTKEAKERRMRNTNQYTNPSPKLVEIRTENLRKIGSALGIQDLMKKEDKQIKFKPNPSSNLKRETTLSEYAMEVFFGKKSDALLAPLEDGTAHLPSGYKGNIIKGQRGALSDLFTAIIKTNDFTKKRIFAKAVSPAEPGKDFDIILGHYKI